MTTPVIPSDPAERRVIGAYKLVLRDLGVPEHPRGECPESPCPCAGTAELAFRRVQALLLDPAIEDADYCLDCHALIPFTADSYAVDCGVACVPCGEKRYGYQNAEYFLPGPSQS